MLGARLTNIQWSYSIFEIALEFLLTSNITIIFQKSHVIKTSCEIAENNSEATLRIPIY